MELSTAWITSRNERMFGLKLGSTFAIIGALFWWRNQLILPVLCWGIAAILVLSAVGMPHRLRKVERHWMQMGHWIGRLTTPIIMSVVFVGLLSPAGMLLRLFGVNPIGRRRSSSFWIPRKDGGRSDLKRQY